MTEKDRLETRQMFTDILEGHYQKVEGQFNLVNLKLSSIEAQTTRTNGRVTALEDKTEKLELSDFSRKAIIMFSVKALGIIAVLAGLVYGFFELFQ